MEVMSSVSEHVEVDNNNQSSLWWLKQKVRDSGKARIPDINVNNVQAVVASPDRFEFDISTSIDEFLEKDPNYNDADDGSEADIATIIQEIHKLASQSPIGNFDTPASDNKSVEEILEEAEKLYLESSKSFEQLSCKSRSSLDYSISKSSSLSFRSKKSTPSPRSSYSALKSIGVECARLYTIADQDKGKDEDASALDYDLLNSNKVDVPVPTSTSVPTPAPASAPAPAPTGDRCFTDVNENEEQCVVLVDDGPVSAPAGPEEDKWREELPATGSEQHVEPADPDEDIDALHQEIEHLKTQLKMTKQLVEESERSLNKQTFSLQQELDERDEQLKDTREQNTVLQLQLDNLTKTHQELRVAYDELLASKRGLEARLAELDANFARYKAELATVREQNERLLESEGSLKRQLEIERLQSKTTRLQNDKDAKCIQDLNRQVKEMERILHRKHPDSVSALIVASKADGDCGLAARSLLEGRIRQLENEASAREAHSNSIFADIQDKFNQMKAKYESHIEDLEVHVNDLKQQLKSKMDTYDIYTQTYGDEPPPPPIAVTDVLSVSTQTEEMAAAAAAAAAAVAAAAARPGRPANKRPDKEDTYLLATIRGLQADLAAKEKQLVKLQKELEELRKTNRKLQKERESSFKAALPMTTTTTTTMDKRQTSTAPSGKSPESPAPDWYEREVRALKDERDKLRTQLCRLEEDYQNLKTKRLQDLNTLQEAHERELTTYMSNIGPMREQLDVQQVTIGALQQQLASAKEQLAILTVERDHLDERLKAAALLEVAEPGVAGAGDGAQLPLQKKIAYLERRYEERERRLRAIVHGLAQKQLSARDCAQCAARHQQLIGYKAELDQLLATLRCLQ